MNRGHVHLLHLAVHRRCERHLRCNVNGHFWGARPKSRASDKRQRSESGNAYTRHDGSQPRALMMALVAIDDFVFDKETEFGDDDFGDDNDCPPVKCLEVPLAERQQDEIMQTLQAQDARYRIGAFLTPDE